VTQRRKKPKLWTYHQRLKNDALYGFSRKRPSNGCGSMRAGAAVGQTISTQRNKIFAVLEFVCFGVRRYAFAK